MKELEKKLKADPYNFICDWAESLYPKTGRKVFEVLSLMPCSLIIPDLPFMSKSVRSNINALFLAPPGGGKTSLAKLFQSVTINPMHVESITPARLEKEVSSAETFSLIVGDFARMSRHPEVIKIIEGILGEEKEVLRHTMRTDINTNTEAVALLCGVATDLHYYILGGLIFRVVPILVGHTIKDHSEIGQHIKNKIGIQNTDDNNIEEMIKNYYKELAELMSDEKKCIKGYDIPPRFKDKSYEEWDKLSQELVKEFGFNSFREYQEFFRFLVAHAFLNIFNRKVENGILYTTEEDFKIAIRLMKQNIIFKYRLLKSESYARNLRNAMDFKRVMESNVDDDYKTILRNIVKIKEGGKIALLTGR